MLRAIWTLTNERKAQLIAFANAVMAALIAFDVAMTQAQIGAIDGVLNTGLLLFVVGSAPATKKRLNAERAAAARHRRDQHRPR